MAKDPSRTARSRLTFELSRQTGLRRTPSSARLSTNGAQEAKGQIKLNHLIFTKMRKEEVRLTQVYRINGRLVVADSIEGAINIYREWMTPGCPDINNVERMGNDSYSCVGNEALMYSESSALAEELKQVYDMNNELEARLKEVTAQLIDLQQANCAAGK